MLVISNNKETEKQKITCNNQNIGN